MWMEELTDEELEEQIKFLGEFGLEENKWGLVKESVNRKLKGIKIAEFMDSIYKVNLQ